MDNLLWNLHQEQRIADAQISAAGARQGASQIQDAMRRLEDRLEKLSLICRAVWTFVQERGGMTEEDLLKRVEELDLSDGQRDGKLAPASDTCGGCGRRVSRRHPRCLFCGTERGGATAFDKV
jgi:hypothetical protein